MNFLNISVLFVLGLMVSTALGKPHTHSMNTVNRVVRNEGEAAPTEPPKPEAEATLAPKPAEPQGSGGTVDDIRKDPENPKPYGAWAVRISPSIQATVDEHYGKKKAEGDEIKTIGDKSRIHQMDSMMEKHQYDVMQKNFKYADARFGEVRADGPPASDGKPKEATDAPAATAAPPPAGTA